MKTIRFLETERLYDQAASRFETLSARACRARGRFLVALAGGSTPLALYARLARSKAIDWEKAHIFWSDERCVPPDDSASNFGAARRTLLDHVPIPEDQIHRIEGERDPLDAADAYEVLVRRELGGSDPFDLILLGIGVDGHTASLFPRHQALTETERWVLPVHAPSEPPWRVTMTLPLINAARNVLLLAVGTDKADAVRAFHEGATIPASSIRPERGQATLLTDAEAM